MSNLTLYRFTLSGHSHRAELFTSLLKLDVNMVDVALQNGEQKQADFLKMNIFGQVPVLKQTMTLLTIQTLFCCTWHKNLMQTEPGTQKM